MPAFEKARCRKKASVGSSSATKILPGLFMDSLDSFNSPTPGWAYFQLFFIVAGLGVIPHAGIGARVVADHSKTRRKRKAADYARSPNASRLPPRRYQCGLFEKAKSKMSVLTLRERQGLLGTSRSRLTD